MDSESSIFIGRSWFKSTEETAPRRIEGWTSFIAKANLFWLMV